MNWITLFPEWYLEERNAIKKHYPHFVLDRHQLDRECLIYYGELAARPPGGTKKHPVILVYPEATPFEPPRVILIETLPITKSNGQYERSLPRMYDYRHQMPDGSLCLFQRETRSLESLASVHGVDALRRAERWFLGHYTEHWPTDSAQSELQAHFRCEGDILLSEIFYSSELEEGRGEFYMQRDVRRISGFPHDTGGSFVTTAITEESSGIPRVYDARNDLSLAYPWIRDEAWSPEQVVQILQKPEKAAEIGLGRGFWVSLPREPRPFHSGSGLLSTLSSALGESEDSVWGTLSSLMGSDISTERFHILGLRYPARDNGVEWLVVVIIRGSRRGMDVIKNEEEKKREFCKARIIALRVHSIRPTELTLRNTGVVNEEIREKTVALVGLGALGSVICEQLVKAGVNRLRICDADRLSTGNVSRHIGSITDFGVPKTTVVAERMLKINPYLRFDTSDGVINGSIVESLRRLEGFIAPADLVISTVADESIESVIDQVAVLKKKVVLYSRALRRGSMGRVFLVRPGQDACKKCLGHYALRGRLNQETPADWIDVEESAEDVLIHECGRPLIPGSAVDLSFIATLTTRLALDFLEGRLCEENHWLWHRNEESAIDSRLDKNFDVFSGCIKPTPACPTCSEPEIAALSMTEEARDTILTLTLQSPEAETCGVLIGFVDDERRAVVLRATGPGAEAKRSKAGCSRDINHTQEELETAAGELGERGRYLGEWHSHLERDPQPSTRDLESLFGITDAPHYMTRSPVMVIVGLDPDKGTVENLRSWSFRPGDRIYEIDNGEVTIQDALKLPINKNLG